MTVLTTDKLKRLIEEVAEKKILASPEDVVWMLDVLESERPEDQEDKRYFERILREYDQFGIWPREI